MLTLGTVKALFPSNAKPAGTLTGSVVTVHVPLSVGDFPSSATARLIAAGSKACESALIEAV
jgi:hypothetical protein